MIVNVSFANPLGPYDMLWNKCVGRHCHVEMSMKIKTDLFRVTVNNSIDQAYDPSVLEGIMKRTKDTELRTLNVCFYIMWGSVVSLRFLSEMTDDALMGLPSEPVYDTIPIDIDEEEAMTLVSFNLRQLGKPYDTVMALLLFSPITLRSSDNPDKFFCSQLVMRSLKEAGIYEDQMQALSNIDHMKPTDVYDWLRSQKRRVKEEPILDPTEGPPDDAKLD